MSGAEVAVVVVSYNTRELTAACVASLLASDEPNLEVIVVDNESGDGTVEDLRGRYPAVSVIESGGNLGFARACNLGASSMRAAYVMFVNPDATVAPDAVRVLREYAEAHPANGLYGGLVSDGSGRPDVSSARPLPTLWSQFCFGVGLTFLAKGSRWFDPEAMSQWDRSTPREVGMLSGAMLMVRADVWTALGGFDPDFFMYGEDADLAHRAAALGHRPVCVPHARATHDSGAASTSDRKAFLKHRGIATHLTKNWSTPRRQIGLALLYCGVALRAYAPLRGEQGIDWRALWRRRREWGRGYP